MFMVFEETISASDACVCDVHGDVFSPAVTDALTWT